MNRDIQMCLNKGRIGTLFQNCSTCRKLLKTCESPVLLCISFHISFICIAKALFRKYNLFVNKQTQMPKSAPSKLKGFTSRRHHHRRDHHQTYRLLLLLPLLLPQQEQRQQQLHQQQQREQRQRQHLIISKLNRKQK